MFTFRLYFVKNSQLQFCFEFLKIKIPMYVCVITITICKLELSEWVEFSFMKDF